MTSEAYERIAGEIVEAVKTATFDAIYLDLHGAMVAEHIDDGEGELLKRVRALVGPDMKIAVSVDSHANMTAEMFVLADVIAGYRTYPHVDMADTGRRAAEMLLQRGRHEGCGPFCGRTTAFSHSRQRHVHDDASGTRRV